MLSRIQFNHQDKTNYTADRKTILTSRFHFNINGFLIIENIFNKRTISNLNKYLQHNYLNNLNYQDSNYSKRVDHKRYMLNVELGGVFNDINIFCNPIIYSIVEQFLGPGFVLNSFGAVISLPGAKKQHTHRDHPYLFENINEVINLPPYAVSLFIPLIKLDSMTGTTRVYKESHHINKVNLKKNYIDPVLDIGSCMLVDYRTLHAGLSNKSSHIRPILYFVYSKPWFRDSVNFKYFNPLSIGYEVYEKLPANRRHLFSHLHK